MAGRLSTFEREVQGLLSDFSQRLVSGQDRANTAAAAAAAAPPPPKRLSPENTKENEHFASPPTRGGGDTPPATGRRKTPPYRPVAAPREGADQGDSERGDENAYGSNSDAVCGERERPTSGGGSSVAVRPRLAPTTEATTPGGVRDDDTDGGGKSTTGGACNSGRRSSRRGNHQTQEGREDSTVAAGAGVEGAEGEMSGEGGATGVRVGAHSGSGTVGRSSSSINSGSVTGFHDPGDSASSGSGDGGETSVSAVACRRRRVRLEELRREKEKLREIATRGLYA